MDQRRLKKMYVLVRKILWKNMRSIYLSMVNAVIVSTVAFVKLSAANLCILQTVSSKGYSRNHNM